MATLPEPAPQDMIGALSPEAYLQTMRDAFSGHYRDGSDEWSQDPEMRGFPGFVEQHVGLRADARILDVGCGRGDDARALSIGSRAVVGIDTYAHPDWARPVDGNGGPRFLCRDLESFAGEEKEGFDLVLDNGSFHHQHPGRYLAYLDAVVALLRPDGRFALSTFKQPAFPGRVDERGRLHRFFDDRELAALLSEAGLEERVTRDVFRPRKGNHYRYTICSRSSASTY